MIRKLIFLAFSIWSMNAVSQVERVEPPNWWTGFENNQLQLLVYGNEVGNASPAIDYPGVEIQEIHKADSPNYLFIDLLLEEDVKPGTFQIRFNAEGKKEYSVDYELKEKAWNSEELEGFDASDVIYLVTPDRFANGDPSNDIDESLLEKTIDRNDDYGRHGGDIRGMIQHLDYIDNMGFTALWSSPLLINDMSSGSYHGYAITDFYKVDPRFGTLEEYKELADKARERDIKLIMDQVANHSGIEHWWMKDLPFEDWINYQDRFEKGEPTIYSNHRRTTNQDPYAAQADKKRMNDGWFVDSMPDLNQRNPFMAAYIIQNSIWWIETLGLGGIRQDTYPYPDKEFMTEWAGAIMKEYPNFNIVGEEWSYNPLLIQYWQKGSKNSDGYVSNLPSTMDFAMQKHIIEAMREEESWDRGLVKIYEGLANDFIYPNPESIMVFLDNHDKSRIFTELEGNIEHTKMALAYMLTLPRIPQIYYGTEILMDDFEKPGDHGLIRTDFPGGWEGDSKNAFNGEGLSAEKKDMQEYLQKLLNFRKSSKAIQEGKMVHFAPEDGVYLLVREKDAEIVVLILNKNEGDVTIDLQRFSELDLFNTNFTNIITGEALQWKKELTLSAKGAYLFSNQNQ